MIPLIGLPKTAKLISFSKWDLTVRDNKIQGDQSLLNWLLDAMQYGDWREILAQMIQQGFKLKGVIEQCIEDLRDPKKFTEMFYWFNGKEFEDKQLIELSTGETGKRIKTEFTERLKACKDWKDLQIIVNHTDDFYKKIEGMIAEKMRQ